jgi:ribosomal RNA-processing protein 17
MPQNNDRKRKIHKTNAKAVDAISFDPEARQEYLSGFHKRKVQRAEHGREIAQKKFKEATVQARKEVRTRMSIVIAILAS